MPFDVRTKNLSHGPLSMGVGTHFTRGHQSKDDNAGVITYTSTDIQNTEELIQACEQVDSDLPALFPNDRDRTPYSTTTGRFLGGKLAIFTRKYEYGHYSTVHHRGSTVNMGTISTWFDPDLDLPTDAHEFTFEGNDYVALRERRIPLQAQRILLPDRIDYSPVQEVDLHLDTINADSFLDANPGNVLFAGASWKALIVQETNDQGDLIDIVYWDIVYDLRYRRQGWYIEEIPYQPTPIGPSLRDQGYNRVVKKEDKFDEMLEPMYREHAWTIYGGGGGGFWT